MRISVVNLRADGFMVYKQGEAEYIGRPNRFSGRKGSPLANPFRIGHDGTRDEVVAQYEVWIRGQLREGNQEVLEELIRLGSKAYREGKLVLACFCAPLPCHGDVIAKMLHEALDVERVV